MRVQTVLALFMILQMVGTPSLAQPKKKLADRVDELAKSVDEALKTAADGTAALKAIQDLQTKVSALKLDLDQLKTIERSFQETRVKLEDYENRLGNLELALAAIKMQMGGQVPSAGFKEGFFIQSQDRKFLLRIGGLLQTAYVGRLFSEEQDGSKNRLAYNESTFIIPRARIATSGHLLNWRLTYRVEMDFGETDPGPLLEGWGEVQIHRALKLRLGKQKIPLSRQFLIHSVYQQFVDRCGATTSFAPGWDLGAMIRGDVPVVGVLSYQIGMFNGAGSSAGGDDNTDFLYAARLVYQPLGPLPYSEGDAEISKLKIAVGGAFTYNLARTDLVERSCTTADCDLSDMTKADADGDGNPDNVGIYGVSAELVFRLGGIAWQSELFYRQEDPGAVAEDRSFWGLYSQASFYHFNSTLELAARYGYWEPNHYGMSRNVPRPDKVHEVAVVLNALTWGRNVKWQAEYAHQWLRDLKTGDKALGHNELDQVRLQMQLAF